MTGTSPVFRAATALLLLVSPFPSLAAQTAGRPVPGYPRDGAFVLADNPRVTVWEVLREKGSRSALYQLTLDQVAVTLTEGAVRFTAADGSYRIEQLRLGGVRFEPKGTVTQDEGLSEIPSREVVFQLKDYVPPRPVALVPGMPGQFPRVGATRLFENDRITVWDQTFLPDPPMAMHLHYTDAYAVFIQPGKLQSRDAGQVPGEPFDRAVGYILGGGRVTKLIRDVKEIPPSTTPPQPGRLTYTPHEEWSVAGMPRAIFVEFKYGK